MSLLLQPQAEPLPGYRLLEPLGKGGFGEVWKCEAPGGLFKADQTRPQQGRRPRLRRHRRRAGTASPGVRPLRPPSVPAVDGPHRGHRRRARRRHGTGRREPVRPAAPLPVRRTGRRAAKRPAGPAVGGGRGPRRDEPPPPTPAPGRQAAQPAAARQPRQGRRLRPGQPAAAVAGPDADLPAGRRQPGLRLAGSVPRRTQSRQRSVQPRRGLPRIAHRRTAVRGQEPPADGAAARPRRAGPEPAAGAGSGRRRPRPLQRSP